MDADQIKTSKPQKGTKVTRQISTDWFVLFVLLVACLSSILIRAYLR
jgi:hypothetical protein